MGNANGTSPLDNMRNLEHYLNDIMRGAGDASDHHLKGKYFFLFHLRFLSFSFIDGFYPLGIGLCHQ